MKANKHRLNLLIGLWVLAGLLVLGLNGNVLLSLLDEPLAGYSPGVHQVDQGFRRYRTLLSLNDGERGAGMEQLSQRFAVVIPEPEPTQEEEKSVIDKVVETVKMPLVSLPVLSGIVTSRSASGEEYRMALLESDVYAEGEKLETFTIREISADGVILAKGNQTWFLKRPEIAYSVSKQ